MNGWKKYDIKTEMAIVVFNESDKFFANISAL